MSFLQQVFSPVKLRSQSVNPAKGVSFSSWGIPVTKAGQKVNQTSALSVGAFYNAVHLRCNDIAKLPKGVYKKEADRRERQSNHPVEELITLKPNNFQTAFSFWYAIEQDAVIKGDGFARIVRNDRTGVAQALEYLDYHKVTIIKGQNQLFYKYGDEILASSEVLHIYHFSTNGYSGTGVITYAANSIGITLAGQSFMGNTLEDKGLTHGVLESEQPVNPDNKKALESGFKSKMSQGGAHNVALLDEGFKYKRIQITPQEADFIANNREGVIAVAQFLGVAPHKLKMLDQANYSNLQLMTIEHQQDSVLPCVTQIEQEIRNKLFTPAERATTYVKFNLRSQLRGDQKTEAEFITKLIFSKVMTPNEARKLIELNPIEGGDELLQPVNMQTEQQLQKEETNAA